MHPILLLSFLMLSGPPAAPSPGEIRLTIARDPYFSSDQVTMCRVRATNDGGRSWPGKMLRFEARATDALPVVRERGRFGLELTPHGSLETLIALPGRHDRFEVELLSTGKSGADAEHKPRKRASRPRSPKRSG
ncbi:MAG: hypothetical protein ABI968_01925 [Acidobacteriota bacterium]